MSINLKTTPGYNFEGHSLCLWQGHNVELDLRYDFN